MGRDGREVWSKRVARWRDGGLSAKEFAAEIGVNASTLSYWAWRLGASAPAKPRPRPRRNAGRKAAGVEWVEVIAPAMAPPSSLPAATVPSPTSARVAATSDETRFELVLAGGRVLRVPAAFDAEALSRLLAVCEAR